MFCFVADVCVHSHTHVCNCTGRGMHMCGYFVCLPCLLFNLIFSSDKCVKKWQLQSTLCSQCLCLLQPSRTYVLEAPKSNAEEWVQMIKDVWDHYYKG